MVSVPQGRATAFQLFLQKPLASSSACAYNAQYEKGTDQLSSAPGFGSINTVMQEEDRDDDLLPSVIPQFFPAHWLEDAPDIAYSEFPSRIRVGYVRRGDGNYSYIMRDMLLNRGLSIQMLHEVALHNLDSLSEIELTIGKTPGGSEAFLRETDDNFQAARILLPRVHKALMRELGEEYFAAIPCRDWFVCWSKNQSDDWQKRNIERARSNFLEDEYNLTPDIFLRSEAGFTMYLEQTINA
jgi:hypothetical protein